jgi:Rrf2 family protein
LLLVKISARADYALRACIELARAGDRGSTSDAIAEAQDIPQAFLQNVMGDMRRAGHVRSNSRRGGGYWLATPPDRISVADVVRAMDGPLLQVHGVHPDDLRYPESTSVLADLWIAVRRDVTATLEQVSLLDLATGRLLIAVPQPDSGVDRPSEALTA